MKRDLIIVENFYVDPDAVVRHARTLDYVLPYEEPGTVPDGQRASWRASRYRSARDCPFKSSKALIAKLEWLTGEVIDQDAWTCEFPVDDRGYPSADHRNVLTKSAWWNCSFHAKHDQQQKLGDGIHSHSDYDSWNPVGTDGWAGIIYLNKDPADNQTGLRTWKALDPRRQLDWMTPAENWVLQDTFGNAYNRLILHRGGVAHSGTNGWGETVADARLFQTFFFRVKQSLHVPSVTSEDIYLPP
jgi:hypothetical protein